MGHSKTWGTRSPEARDTRQLRCLKEPRAMGLIRLLATLSASPKPRICGISGSARRSMTLQSERMRCYKQEERKANTFAALSISAYVLPSYSKIGSQPLKQDWNERHSGRQSVGNYQKKEDQHTEISGSSRRHEFARCASLEEDRFLAGPSAECKRADCQG
jgi:hypothetical protein